MNTLLGPLFESRFRAFRGAVGFGHWGIGHTWAASRWLFRGLHGPTAACDLRRVAVATSATPGLQFGMSAWPNTPKRPTTPRFYEYSGEKDTYAGTPQAVGFAGKHSSAFRFLGMVIKWWPMASKWPEKGAHVCEHGAPRLPKWAPHDQILVRVMGRCCQVTPKLQQLAPNGGNCVAQVAPMWHLPNHTGGLLKFGSCRLCVLRFHALKPARVWDFKV